MGVEASLGAIEASARSLFAPSGVYGKSITLYRNPDSSVHAKKVLIVDPSQNNHDPCAYY